MNTTTHLLYLGTAVCFVLGLHLMNSPATARRGNQLSAFGMAVAIALTVVVLIDEGMITLTAAVVLAVGVVAGSTAGLIAARRVKMTAMPQLVSLFNAVGGGAAALIAFTDALPGSTDQPTSTTLTTFLDVLIGAVTFSGSLIAAGKLAGVLPGRPLTFAGGRVLNLLLGLTAPTRAV
jgi:H+-translocating NAD(P) transhydrogenase subunit beta